MLGAGIWDCGQIAGLSLQWNIGDIHQEDGPGAARLKFPVDQIPRGAAHPDGFLQPAVRIWCSDGTDKMIFPHEPADLLYMEAAVS